MTFQNPAFLWAVLAVAVPVALHFWHQQRAKPLPWAMLRWLETPNQPPKRGFRFDNLWLLLLRCALLIGLALLLARPTLPPDDQTPLGAVHLVEPDRRVVDAFRFELDRALQRGERLFWATDVPAPVEELGTLPTNAPVPNPLLWQGAIGQVRTPRTRLHLYVRNTPAWVDAPPVSVPEAFVLHALPDLPNRAMPNRIVALPGGRFLGVGTDGRLTSLPQKTAQQSVVATAPLRVWVQFRNPDERRTVRAALAALTSAYGLTYRLDEQPVSAKKYDWIITDRPIEQPVAGALYTTTAPPIRPDLPSVTYLPGPLTTANDAVANGQLPEQLGNALAEWLGLSAGWAPLSGRAFAALFVPMATGSAQASVIGSATNPETVQPRPALQTGLLVLFLGLLLAERWLALRRGV